MGDFSEKKSLKRKEKPSQYGGEKRKPLKSGKMKVYFSSALKKERH